MRAKDFLDQMGHSRPTLGFFDHESARLYCKVYDNLNAAARDIGYWNMKRGQSVYYVGNPHHRPPFRRQLKWGSGDVYKPARDHIDHAVGVWIDVDDVTDRDDVLDELIHRLDWRPTYVCWTGGGFQAFWRFDEPMDDLEDAERINVWLLDEFEGIVGKIDRAFTVDRIWRLPSTKNQKPERKGAWAQIVYADWQAAVDPKDMGRADPTKFRDGVVPVEIGNIDDDVWDAQTVRECLPVNTKGREEAWKLLTDASRYASRSEWVFAFIGAALGGFDRIEDEQIDMVAACLVNPRWPISDYCHRCPSGKPRRDPTGEAARQIGKWLAVNGYGEAG